MSAYIGQSILNDMRMNPPSSKVRPNTTPFNTWLAGLGAPQVTFHKSLDWYLIRVDGYADFAISSDGQSCSCSPVAGLDDETKNHLIRTILLPFALGLRGQIVLHASCVASNGRSVAFLGKSGSGKSTLVTKLTTSICRFVTDDCLHVEYFGEGYVAHPGEPSVRLWDNSFSELLDPNVTIAPPVSYTYKSRIPITVDGLLCNAPCPLTAIFILGESNSDHINIQPLRGGDAHAACSRHSFLIDPDDPEILTASFHRIANLVATVPCFRISFPMDFDLLDDVETAILAQVNALELAA